MNQRSASAVASQGCEMTTTTTTTWLMEEQREDAGNERRSSRAVGGDTVVVITAADLHKLLVQQFDVIVSVSGLRLSH